MTSEPAISPVANSYKREPPRERSTKPALLACGSRGRRSLLPAGDFRIHRTNSILATPPRRPKRSGFRDTTGDIGLAGVALRRRLDLATAVALLLDALSDNAHAVTAFTDNQQRRRVEDRTDAWSAPAPPARGCASRHEGGWGCARRRSRACGCLAGMVTTRACCSLVGEVKTAAALLRSRRGQRLSRPRLCGVSVTRCYCLSPGS
jgi:hypothetical protein